MAELTYLQQCHQQCFWHQQETRLKVTNYLTHMIRILEVNSCWQLVIAQKIPEPVFLQFCWLLSCGWQMAAMLSTSLYPGQEEGVVRDIGPLYQESKDFPEAPGDFHLYLNGPQTVSWPALAVGEQESKQLAFLVSIMEDTKGGGFENGSWLSQPMASAYICHQIL